MLIHSSDSFSLGMSRHGNGDGMVTMSHADNFTIRLLRQAFSIDELDKANITSTMT